VPVDLVARTADRLPLGVHGTERCDPLVFVDAHRPVPAPGYLWTGPQHLGLRVPIEALATGHAAYCPDGDPRRGPPTRRAPAPFMIASSS